MKTKIFFTSCIVFSVVLQANAQIEFAPIGAEWYYNWCAEGNIAHSYLRYYIVSEKDTIVEENNCRVLRQYSGHSNVAHGQYIIKQEQGKVYYYYQDKFNLLFDFDADVNDTVKFTFTYREYFSYDVYKDTMLSARYQIESITTNAQNLKTFTTTILEEDKFADYNMEILPWYHLYTEKIGYNNEFMPILDNLVYTAEGQCQMLRCYYDADFSFISDEWAATSFPCDDSFTTKINTPKGENITIYPNSFSDNIFVSMNNDGGNIEITNVAGKVVYYSKLSNEITEILTSHLFKGIYFIKIQNKDNSIQTFKIIKS